MCQECIVKDMCTKDVEFICKAFGEMACKKTEKKVEKKECS